MTNKDFLIIFINSESFSHRLPKMSEKSNNIKAHAPTMLVIATIAEKKTASNIVNLLPFFKNLSKNNPARGTKNKEMV